MEVKIDNANHDVSLIPTMSLRDAVNMFANTINGERCRVVRVLVDGQDITGKQDHPVQNRPVGEFKLLELFTGDPFQLAIDTVPMILDFITNMRSEVQKSTENYRLSRIPEANASMMRVADGLVLITHIVEQMRSLLRLDFGSMVYHDVSILDHYSKLGQMVDELVAAQGETDWILVADLLEYELLPMLDEWEGIVRLIEATGAKLINVAVA